MKRAAIGISAHLGWAATSIVSIERPALRVLRTDRIETADPEDREAREPFHVAGGFEGLGRVPQPPSPEAALRRGLRKQRQRTARELSGLGKRLAESGHGLAFAGILVSRGRAADHFEKSIGSHTQIHIEEGIAVREAFRLALTAARVRVHDIDQKIVPAIASEELAQTERALQAALDKLKPENAGAWRKEEKLAALAAWIAWTRSAR